MSAFKSGRPAVCSSAGVRALTIVASIDMTPPAHAPAVHSFHPALRVFRVMTLLLVLTPWQDGGGKGGSGTMTPGANSLMSRATRTAPSGPPTPILQFRAFVEAFRRLGYDLDRLLGDVGCATSH